MLISSDTSIPFPRSLVYTTYRDSLVELIPHLPNVRAIQVKSRREEGNRIYSVNEWHGGGEIPMAARAILSEDMLSWTEYDTWNETDFTMEWRIQTHAFTEAVRCVGKNRFIEDGNKTRVESRGELVIDPHKIQGVPSFLAGGVARVVEEFLGSKVGPNLVQMSEGVRHYLTHQKTR
jgi:hypothetical protein